MIASAVASSVDHAKVLPSSSVHIGWTTHCPVCGHDVTQLDGPPDCGHVFCLTESVRTQDVYADALALLELAGPGRA